MNRRRITLLGVLFLALLLTPVAQRVMHWLLLEPLAYYWWGIKQVIRVIPDSLYWLFFLACFGFLALIFLMRDIFLHRARPEKKVLHQGPVAYLAENIDRAGQSYFFKWVIANRLANIALHIRMKEDQVAPGAIAPRADPNVQSYLENGLRSSFMDYRQKRNWFIRRMGTPFDVNISDVIDYLESQMEQSRE